MLTFLRLVPSILAAALMGAHFLRGQGPWAAAGFALLPCLYLLRRRWVLTAMRGLLIAGALEWARVAWGLAQMRIAFGEPWTRLGLILGAVAAVSLLAAWPLGGERLRRDFPRGEKSAGVSAAAFLLTYVLLVSVRWKAGADMLLAERFLPGSFWIETALLATWAALAASWLLDDRRVPQVRFRLWALFSAVFFAQLALGLAGIERCLMSGSLHLPVPAMIAAGPVYRGGGYLMVALFLATIVAVGPAWCSHLCYVGAWDNAFARRRAKAGVGGTEPGTRRGDETRRRWLHRLDPRWVTLAITVLGALLLRRAGASALTATLLGGAFGIVGVLLMATASRRSGLMVHCTRYCPIGALAVTLGRINPFRLRINAGCRGCSLCVPVCRYGALREEDLERGRPGINCTLCGDCLSSCRRGLIEFRFPGLSPRSARGLFVVLIAALHALFLGVGRL